MTNIKTARKALTTFVAAVVFSANAASASQLFKYDTSSQIDSKQFGYTSIAVSDTGKVDISTKFSNGKRYDGDTFTASVSLYDNSDNVVLAIRQIKGINATGGIGSANEATVNVAHQLSPAKAQSITRATVKYGFKDSVDDEEIWKALQKIAEAFFEKDHDPKVGGGSSGNGRSLQRY